MNKVNDPIEDLEKWRDKKLSEEGYNPGDFVKAISNLLKEKNYLKTKKKNRID